MNADSSAANTTKIACIFLVTDDEDKSMQKESWKNTKN
jgi:hypothetical protein